MVIEWAAYSLIGACAGFFAGLLGIGGGLILIPALSWLFKLKHVPESMVMHLAAGTTLAAILVTTLTATYSHHCHRGVSWHIFARLAPGIILGCLLGALYSLNLSGDVLRLLLGIFIITIAVRILLAIEPKATQQLPNWMGVTGAGLMIGGISGLLGIGGGLLTIPFLLRCNIPIRFASGTSAACAFLISLMGTLSFSWHHYVHWWAVLWISLSSIAFVPLGTKLALHLPAQRLKQLFAILLFITGIDLLYAGLKD